MRKGMRADVYRAMRAGLETNTGYVYRGRDVKDRDGGPQAGLGTLLMLARRGWVRLVKADVLRRDGRLHREVAGAWITAAGRSALRDEVRALGHPMPARLVLAQTAATRSVTGQVDPFALIASGREPELALPF